MHLDELLFAIVLILAAAAVCVAIFKRLGLGAILGYLAAGIIVGPSGFTIAENVDDLLHITELGVVLLLFIIGLEMRPTRLWSMRRNVFGFGSAQVLVTAAVIISVVLVLSPIKSWQTAVILGFGFALSSTAFVMQLLTERGEMTTPYGSASFSVLLLQDIAIVPLLALVPLLAGGADAGADATPLWLDIILVVGSIALVLGVGRYVIPYALEQMARRHNMEAFVVIAMLAALGAAWVMEIVGLSMALGAFLMGMMLSGSDYRHQVEASVEPFKGMMIGMFFISVGMSIDLILLAENLWAVVRLVILIIAIKMAVLFLLALGFGFGRGNGIRIATYLSQCGEFGFVLFGAAKVAGLMPDLLFVIALLTISVSMALTPVLVKLGEAVARRLDAVAGEPAADHKFDSDAERHVIVAGYGRVGRIVATMLEWFQIPYVAYDIDPDKVASGKRRGHKVHFGDLSNRDVLVGAGIGKCAVLVMTLADLRAAERLASMLHYLFPGVAIHALVHDWSDCGAMIAKGARTVVPEVVEGSIHLGRELLTGIGVPEAEVRELVQSLRSDDYRILRN